MKLLILGGTEFAGRAYLDEALARGWEVSLFNRGTHPAPEGVTALRGDRREPGGLAAIERGEWDLVVDTWSWAPSAVRDAARTLAGRAGGYVYVSSRSVYAFPAGAGTGEDAPVVDGSPDAGDADGYAQAKRGGELAALESFGDRALLVRAGLIIGPYENVGRLPWWLRRIARGGPFLAPGPREGGVQYVDVRDMAGWSLDAAAAGLGGAYDVVGPPGAVTMEDVLGACVAVTGADAEPRWVPPERIIEAGVKPWTDLPMWLPPGETHEALHQANVSKALAAGLECRPLIDTVADTWAWLRDIGGEPPQRPDRPVVGLDPRIEASLI
ncbi:NAD-dependent epimerase/dehydratase family protein [Actinomadura viridis]|uniref:Nucleoside-diphosphate-sugar epimerase n=1 Tax=Actinomadura viridis TaxID=58110 RepID=A0A931DPX5_9ACTN|nr:NAD-dependent epimerase/dehydratase family protein [Actinomadura viridis]MBG6091185.1 nucleoside-diphosphate-sugar epimerase [Actinomadura viridis]